MRLAKSTCRGELVGARSDTWFTPGIVLARAPPQDPRLRERREDPGTGGFVHAEEPAGLLHGQHEPRHVVELRHDAPHDRLALDEVAPLVPGAGQGHGERAAFDVVE